MKLRNILIFLTSIFAIIVLGLPVAWNWISVENRLKEYILSEVQPYFDGEVIIDKLSLSYKSLTLQNVSL